MERLYHPDKYKKKFCQNYPNTTDFCEYGKLCSFAHSDSELKIEKLHLMEHTENFNIYFYKTEFCPKASFHDKSSCLYAHNVQDYRRKPNKFSYQAIECEYWNKSDNIKNYSDGNCPFEMNCDKCHGWKEYEYHPNIYKTKACSFGKNCNKKECAFFHFKYDNRLLFLIEKMN